MDAGYECREGRSGELLRIPVIASLVWLYWVISVDRTWTRVGHLVESLWDWAMWCR